MNIGNLMSYFMNLYPNFEKQENPLIDALVGNEDLHRDDIVGSTTS
jgi:hypothetical protein